MPTQTEIETLADKLRKASDKEIRTVSLQAANMLDRIAAQKNPKIASSVVQYYSDVFDKALSVRELPEGYKSRSEYAMRTVLEQIL